jgi:predicted RNA-binding Zn ribbon-like protein
MMGINPSLRGSLALDLINTETLDRGMRCDRLSSPDALSHWWEQVLAEYPDECLIEAAGVPEAWTWERLNDVLELRKALRALLIQVVEQQTINERDLQSVNQILALGYSALERAEPGSIRAAVHLRDPVTGCVLLPIALSAVRLFTEADWERLHQCKNDRCIVFFYDTSKSGTRRWCSASCMNRARSIEHYHRSRKEASVDR